MNSGKIYNSLYNVFGLDKPDYNSHGVNWVVIDEQLEKIFYVGGQIIAILATIVLMFLTFIVCIEILYLQIPFLRETIEDKAQRSDKLEKVCHIALRDARRAEELANTTQTGQSAMFIYISIKIKQLVIAYMCCYLAINLDMFINLVLNIVSPVIQNIKLILHTR